MAKKRTTKRTTKVGRPKTTSVVVARVGQVFRVTITHADRTMSHNVVETTAEAAAIVAEAAWGIAAKSGD